MKLQTTILVNFHRKIAAILSEFGITLFGVADLDGVSTLPDRTGRSFPRAISYARRMDLAIMASIKDGLNQAYADEYARVNDNIDAAAFP